MMICHLMIYVDLDWFYFLVGWQDRNGGELGANQALELPFGLSQFQVTFHH